MKIPQGAGEEQEVYFREELLNGSDVIVSSGERRYITNLFTNVPLLTRAEAFTTVQHLSALLALEDRQNGPRTG